MFLFEKEISDLDIYQANLNLEHVEQYGTTTLDKLLNVTLYK
jgi:hypothetical protein